MNRTANNFVVVAVIFILVSLAQSLVAQDQTASSNSDEGVTRTALAKKLFVFEDAYVSALPSEKFLWVTKTGSDSTQTAQFQLFEISNDFSELKLLRQMQLLNPVKPMVEYLSPDGRFFVTFDEAGTCGNSPRDLVIYDLALSTVTAKRIEDFLPKSRLAQLTGPIYMGGDGLREWHRGIARYAFYDSESMMLYPTPIRYSSLAEKPSTIPYLSIDLPSGRVAVEDKAAEGSEGAKETLFGKTQAKWATEDGTFELSTESKIGFILLMRGGSLEKDQPRNVGYQLNSKTGNYKRIELSEFLKKSNLSVPASSK